MCKCRISATFGRIKRHGEPRLELKSDKMKTVIKYLILLPLISACVQDVGKDTDSDVAELPTTLFQTRIASSEDRFESKTVLGEKYDGKYYPNYWSVGDAISVNGYQSKPLTLDSDFVGTSNATFEIQGNVSAPYYFVYPASAVTEYNDETAVINLPEKQEWLSATYDSTAFIMIGRSEDDMLIFNPMMSVIKLNVNSSYESKLRSITFMTLGTEKVSGEFVTDFSCINGTEDANSYVHLIAPDGGVTFGSEVNLLIPSQTYDDGMAFALRATDGTQMIYSTKSSFTAEAGVIYPLSVNYVPEDSDIMLMSSNVRFASARSKSDNPDTGDRDWTNRRSAYYTMLNTLKPDIVGLQEAEQEQVVDIKNNCQGYSHVGYGRKSGKDITSSFSSFEQLLGKKHGESTTILYRTDKFTKHSDGWFCHSNTPNVADSYFPGTEDEQPRISTWVVLTHKDTGKKFFYLNTHTCLYDEPMQKEIKLIKDKVSELNTDNLPVILSGDWNLVENDSWMNPITTTYLSARRTAPSTDNSYTYHWWESTNDKRQIDHIYYAGLDCTKFHTVNQKWDGLYISDHYPIYSKFKFETINIPMYTSPVEGNAGHENYAPENLF